MTSTTLPRRDQGPRGRLSPQHGLRAVQGYTPGGEPFGEPGDQQGYYHWPGTSQMYSSARDMAIFLAANLGELATEPSLRKAMARLSKACSRSGEGATIIEKYGGLHNAAAYIGMMPDRKIGVVILGNRGNHEIGRALLRELSGP
jgi:beta-lactamase class C